jgi:long-chain acyl-CoA synthetase
MCNDMHLRDRFRAWAEKQPDATFIITPERTVTWGRANSEACRLANALIRLGLRRGDRVAVTLPNCPEHVIAVQACFKSGLIPVPTNPLYTLREAYWQYASSGVKAAVCLAPYANLHHSISLMSGVGLESIITVACESGPPPNNEPSPFGARLYDYRQLLAAEEPKEPELTLSPGALTAIIYTCGTTGVSKGCCITGENRLAAGEAWIRVGGFREYDMYRVLIAMPLYHVFGFQTAINAATILGGSMVLISPPCAKDVLSALKNCRVTVWPAVPALLTGVMSLEGWQDGLRSVRYIGCGAAPLDSQILRAFEEKTGLPILDGSGATETTQVAASNRPGKRKPGSVGLPYPGTQMKVIDADSGKLLTDPGSVGELCFRGPQIVREYWQNPAETARAFQDGWWHSGDIGYQDAEGFVFLVDRLKDCINCSGFKVFCNEVDEVLRGCPGVADAAVAGINDPKRGEAVKAFIVPNPGASVDLNSVREYCRPYLAPYKIPTSMEILEALPKTVIGKINRKELRTR